MQGGNKKALTNDRTPNRLTEPMRRLYQAIRAEKPYFDERIDPKDFYRVFVVEPQRFSERIRAHSGAFVVSAFHKRLDRLAVSKRFMDVPIYSQYEPIYSQYELIVSYRRKERLMDELRSFNITRESLFPSLDESARAIVERAERRIKAGDDD